MTGKRSHTTAQDICAWPATRMLQCVTSPLIRDLLEKFILFANRATQTFAQPWPKQPHQTLRHHALWEHCGHGY
jgi:hypothetical protein